MLSLILPTYNEAKNLLALLREIDAALSGMVYEIIVVDDDSPDKTWEVAEKEGGKVRVLRRIGRRGLSSAVTEGFSIAKGNILAVMDADGQHDPALLPAMAKIVAKANGLVLGSRYTEGGSVEGWVEARHCMSRIATAFGLLVCRHRVSDPMSGFFAIDRSLFDRIKKNLRPRGFKILLEIISWLPASASVDEVPLVFRLRKVGQSKLNARIELQYLWQVLSLLLKGRGGSQGIFFAALLCVFLVSFMPRIGAIGRIYIDPAMARTVQTEMNRIASEQGWVLSDMALREVREGGMRIVHRQHHRGEDEVSCYDIAFRSSTLRTCRDE